MASFHDKDGIDIVFGAGGGKGPGEIGAYKALLELGVPIGTITGVSVGNLIAVMATNGISPDDMAAETLRGLRQRNDLGLLIKTFTPGDLISIMVGGPIDMTVPMQEMVDRLVEEADLEDAGLEVGTIQENPQYLFISESAQGATATFGVKSLSVLATKRR